MPVKISRLRYWFGAGAISVCAIVAIAYFHGRARVENALKEVPGKIGIQVQQTAEGFTISRSEAGRTLFKIQAGRAVKYKAGGLIELHNVDITVHGRDSSGFDRISGKDFTYDPKSGDVSAQGEVSIDLQANPAGIVKHHETDPTELRNPIHLQTSGLVFNQKTGNAHTDEELNFEVPQARGSSSGANYNASSGVLTLLSDVQLTSTEDDSTHLVARSASINKLDRTITFVDPRAQTTSERLSSNQAVMYLRPDNKAERVFLSGSVEIDSTGKKRNSVRAAELDVRLANNGKTLQRAFLSGNVTLALGGDQPSEATAERAELIFSGKNVLTSVRAEGNVNLRQQQAAKKSGGAQQVEMTAPVVNLQIAGGRRLRTATTSGPSQIEILPLKAKSAREILVNAGQFVANFDAAGQISSLNGYQSPRILSRSKGKPDQVSTSDTLKAAFSGGQVTALTQQGHVEFSDGTRKAWADEGRYAPAAQLLVLTGSPRVVDAGVTTTADVMKLDRATGDADASGNVKTTYSDLKAQPKGAFLASSSPIHVTAQKMTAHNSPAVAIYTGKVRLWQDANVIQAPRIQFDRDRRDVVASGTPDDPVSTVLVEADAKGKITPVTINSPQLTYFNSSSEVRLSGGVTVQGADATLTASQMNIMLEPQSRTKAAGISGKVERIVAEGGVIVQQEGRKTTGGQLTYTPADGKFVMTGDSPSIFDAEHGKITGVSLTFFRHDDTVLVEGSANSPSVTRARVAR